MRQEIVILNMSDIYRQEDFYRHRRFHWIDCTDLAGVNCYCAPEAADELRRRIAPFGPEGIHFMDSGNYHYISEFWLEKIRTPFHLVVFDYHSDMQPPLFPGLLSCGSWVKRALDTNSYLQKVWIVGPDAQAFSVIEASYRSRLVCVSLQQLQHIDTTRTIQRLQQDTLPVYISLDKDVLNRHFARTSWSQGGLSLPALEQLMGPVLQSRRLIGVDICGECAQGLQMLYQNEEEAINNETNRQLLDFLLTQVKAAQ